MENKRKFIRSTTILALRYNGQTVIGGDGQVTMGDSVVKHSAKKIRRLSTGKILAGFAGSASDAITLFEKFEAKLEEYDGQLSRAAVELGKDWRTDRILRRLEALLLAADRDQTFLISGNGDVLEPDSEAIAIGSGGNFALAAARALLDGTDKGPRDIAIRALESAADICVYTNKEILVEELS